jgi:AraC-like DNA-binding protein/ligand-binding sensor protein
MKDENEVLLTYMQATGSNVQIFDCNSQPCGLEGSFNIEQNICRYCKGFSCDSNNCHGNCHGNCREMHSNKIREASRNGRSLVYQCDLGLMFWISPLYDEGKFSGALRGSGVRNSGDNISIRDKYDAGNNEAVSMEEFERRIMTFPPCDDEKITSLSEILHLYAESLSTGNENYHEILGLRYEQQASLSALLEDLKTKYPKGSGFPVYPLEKERQLVTLLRRGNKQEAEKLLDELLSVIIFCNQDHFRYIQLRTIELAVLFARIGANSGSGIENKTRYIKQIQESKTIEELAAILHSMVDNIVIQIVLFQGIPHASAMRKAESFIKGNFTRKISLREVAKIAGLSAPYFSTIFKEEMGENLSKYINRQRVQKASRMLLETDISLAEISNACCFDDQSWFSKIFKNFTGISPSKYRSQGGKINIA